MSRIVSILILAVVLAAVGAYATTYTVRFTDTAVRTTFGAVAAPGEDGRSASIKTEPGVYWKAPYPFQSVTTYDRRGRLLETQSTTIQTEDASQIIVEVFCLWRVEDPLEFFRRFSNAGPRADDHFDAAENQIRSALSTAVSATSSYRIDELFTTEPGGSKIPELEDRILEALNQSITSAAADAEGGEAPAATTASTYGIAIDVLGINRILLPQATTEAVITRMRADRTRIAAELRERGNAIASGVRSRAEADAQKIRAFADDLASETIAAGVRESADFLGVQNENPDLAVYLRQLDLMRNLQARKLTLVMSESDFGFNLLGLSSLRELRPGDIPTIPGLENPRRIAGQSQEQNRIQSQTGRSANEARPVPFILDPAASPAEAQR